MTRLAIDIVLLPSDDIAEWAITTNHELLKTNPSKIVLDKESCVPHISLCMGAVNQQHLPQLIERLKTIAQEFAPLDLAAEGVKVAHPVENESFSMLTISRTPTIQQLQETVMKQSWEFLSYDAITNTMFVNPSQVEPISIKWVTNYAKKYADPGLFHPHLSLGVGEAPPLQHPLPFTASRLAIYQLGNYCTCQRPLASIEL